MRNLRFGPDQVRADGIARVADQLGGRLNLARSSAPGRRRRRRSRSRCSIGQSEVEIHSGELPAAPGWQPVAHFSQFSTRSSGRASKSRSEVRSVAFIDRASAARSMST